MDPLTHEQWAEPAPKPFRGPGAFQIEARHTQSGKWRSSIGAPKGVRMVRDSANYREGELVRHPSEGFVSLDDAEAWTQSRSTRYPTTCYRVVDSAGQAVSFWRSGQQLFINTEKGGEEVMAEQQALQVKKDTLIAKIQGKLDEDRAEWEANHAKEVEAEQSAIEMVKELAEKNPLALVHAIEAKVYLSEFKDPAKFVEYMGERYPKAKLEFTPNQAATKLISVLKAAENETIDVYPTDNYYHYLETGASDSSSSSSSVIAEDL